MSDNNNNNNDDGVNLLKIVELRLQLGSSEDDQENDESKQTQDDHDGGSSSRSPPVACLAAAAATPPLPTSTTSGFDIMKIVRERADAARLETAGGLELVALTEKIGTTSQMIDNSQDRTTDDAQVPQPTILTRQPEYSRQQQPGAYAVDGPGLANDRENHSNTGSNPGTNEEGLDNWVEEIADDEIIAHPIDDDQQIGLLPNAEPLPSNAISRAYYWRQKLLCSLSAEIIVAFVAVFFFVLIFVLTSSKQGNRNQLPNQNESIRIIPGNPVEATTSETFLESLNLPQCTLEALANSRSLQSKAYQWLVNNINNQTTTQPHLPKWRLIQRFAMATFYYSTRGDYWVKNRGWLDWETNECSWEQIVFNQTFSPDLCCNEMGEIKALQFWNANNMEGTIPPEISLLGKSLQSFKVHQQLQLRGTIPTEFGLLTKLTGLVLSVTNIDGSFPSEFGQLQSLQELHLILTSNQGQIPSEIGRLSNLSTFAVVRTDLTGSVPGELYKLPGLQSLTIQECPRLETEYILQEVIQTAKKLRSLMLSSQSSGTVMSIPSEIGKLTELERLHLIDWTNQGTIPSELGQLTKLTSLYMPGNSISGILPHEVFELTELINLNVGSNQLQGTLPPVLFSKLSQLKFISINDNMFSGTVPTELGQLSGLRKLEVQNTSLSGTLPTEILMLEQLTCLVVTETSLSGSIPEELCDRMYQQEIKCYGPPPCKVLRMNTSITACHGTSLCGCDCGPCKPN
ncbi:Leucine Rich Repeat [Seminavis robusta]|uniref:Leucine Rich Repeat n=1 Tax=Seminavis robusta TaxID=568900 RepID=A0A9N8E128_9STRA|nr:Leucine Rich Repeat [Seminavis robusta]|eukprot:Sro513_g157840.1 Leucine Rich Repeat (742) ;mRNA; f:31236-33774